MSNKAKYTSAKDIFSRKVEFPVNNDLPGKADYILEESKQFLLSTIETAESLKKKINLILIFTFSAISIMFSAIVNGLNIVEFNHNIIFVLFLLLASYSITSIILVFHGFIPKNQHANGNEPANLIRQENVDQSLPVMKIATAMRYQDMIIINHKANIKLAGAVKLAALNLVISPLLILTLLITLRRFCIYF